jgi:dienelactone hydrolase
MDLLVLYPLATGDAAVPAAGFPLIVFNHGFLLRGDVYRSYGEHLASHGFVVALPTYPMSFYGLNHSALGLDVCYVINQCLALDVDTTSPLHGLVDESSIGAAGHSLGGKLALLEAVTDSRIRAVATLDPVDGGGPGGSDPILYPSVAPELMPDLKVPLLFVGAQLGSVAYFLIPCAPEDDNYQRLYEAANSPAIEITQLGAGHGQYVDPGAEAAMAACAPGTVATEWVRSSSAAYLTAFFLGHLRGDTAALVWLGARLAEDEAQNRITVQRK